MAGSRDRLVRRIQRRQQSFGPAGSATPREIAELEDRVQRLQAMGIQYGQVRLSPDAAPRGVMKRSVRIRGKCVATEV